MKIARGDPIIVCAAVMILHNNMPKRLISPRHWDMTMRAMACELGLQRGENKNFKEITQGFIDQFGDFHDRKESLIIAKRNNQIRFNLDYESNELFSEMLY